MSYILQFRCALLGNLVYSPAFILLCIYNIFFLKQVSARFALSNSYLPLLFVTVEVGRTSLSLVSRKGAVTKFPMVIFVEAAVVQPA